MRPHAPHHVAARFASDADARGAVEDLSLIPMTDHVRVEMHRGRDHEVESAERHLVIAVAAGMAIGIPVGIAAGLAIMAGIARYEGNIETGLVVGVGIGAGFMFGLLVGGLSGLAFTSKEMEVAREIGCLHLSEDEDVVIAELDRSASRNDVPEAIREIFAAHHGRLVRL